MSRTAKWAFGMPKRRAVTAFSAMRYPTLNRAKDAAILDRANMSANSPPRTGLRHYRSSDGRLRDYRRSVSPFGAGPEPSLLEVVVTGMRLSQSAVVHGDE